MTPGFEDDDPPKNLLDVQSIEFRGVGFSYPSRPEKVVLNKLSFSISKGPNGGWAMGKIPARWLALWGGELFGASAPQNHSEL